MFAPAGPDGDVHVKSAWLPGSPVFVVKVGSWFAERARLTGIGASGMILVPTVREACAGVDILITATGSAQPLVEPDWLATGTHVTSIGADDAGKVELAPSCLARADLVAVDSRGLTALYGDRTYPGSYRR